jgi:cytochrome bd-type quinol oxidase subunit 2
MAAFVPMSRAQLICTSAGALLGGGPALTMLVIGLLQDKLPAVPLTLMGLAWAVYSTAFGALFGAAVSMSWRSTNGARLMRYSAFILLLGTAAVYLWVHQITNADNPSRAAVEQAMLLFALSLFITMGIGAGCAFLWDTLRQ